MIEETHPIHGSEYSITYLEKQIDYHDALLSKASLILPGGSPMASHLHISRITCRKAERSVWKALALLPNSVNPITGKYLNHLADLLYILARFTNKKRIFS